MAHIFFSFASLSQLKARGFFEMLRGGRGLGVGGGGGGEKRRLVFLWFKARSPKEYMSQIESPEKRRRFESLLFIKN